MNDTVLNGWGWVLGLKQNGVIIASFTLDPGPSIYISTSINAQLMTSVEVTRKGTQSTS